MKAGKWKNRTRTTPDIVVPLSHIQNNRPIQNVRNKFASDSGHRLVQLDSENTGEDLLPTNYTEVGWEESQIYSNPIPDWSVHICGAYKLQLYETGYERAEALACRLHHNEATTHTVNKRIPICQLTTTHALCSVFLQNILSNISSALNCLKTSTLPAGFNNRIRVQVENGKCEEGNVGKKFDV